ncbi:hypothetical protein L596_030786 [Steinernema carpocapsae]|uniref:Protein kinase domain-containing protein n=1 Tax=Steinernema carpocapsae TaxID=34508 RepID=A0A4U5LNR2_STECR|nr:hypothetical protein L596_030786 [Steinernema carpocapsae]
MELRNDRTPMTPDGRSAPHIINGSKTVLGINGMKVWKVVGSGSYGTVVLYRSSNKQVAVKSMVCKTEREKIDAQQEVKALKLFGSCPFVINFLADVVDKDMHHVAMDAAQKDFSDIIETLTARKAKQYFKQFISGVLFMHQLRYAHRDLKTPNLLLGSDGNLKICDFNMAVPFITVAGEQLLYAGNCGTEEYHPPEMFLKEKKDQYCPRAYDIWSCGVIFAEFFSGDLPWEAAKGTDTTYSNFIGGQRLGKMTKPQDGNKTTKSIFNFF